jgi:hypothetical protein
MPVANAQGPSASSGWIAAGPLNPSKTTILTQICSLGVPFAADRCVRTLMDFIIDRRLDFAGSGHGYRSGRVPLVIAAIMPPMRVASRC